LFGSVLLLDIPKNLSDIFFEHVIIGKYSLGRIPGYSSNLSFNCFMVHKIINISLDLVKGYTIEVVNNIYYFGRLAIKQILVKKDIDICHVYVRRRP
jgi:hypothetical protein